LGIAITGRMDEMGKKMDELEESIDDLMNQAGLDRDGVLGPGRKNSVANSATTLASGGNTNPAAAITHVCDSAEV